MKLYFKLEIRINCFKCRYWSYEDEAPHSTVVLWGKCIHPNIIYTKANPFLIANHTRACSLFESRRRILI